MDMVTKVLLVGESWVSSATHYKGFDQFGSVTFHLGAEPLVAALQGDEFEITYMTAHDCVEKFPFTLEGLCEYQVILLSDIGANSLLLPPAVCGLVMAGGYFSFQGIDGKARWRRTPVEEALPVTCLPYDDRLEVPDGFKAVVTAPKNHPILEGVEGEWPLLLGANEVVAKEIEGVEVLATLPQEEGGHPLLVTGSYGKGRTVAWTSDIGPHWVPNEFVAWAGYATIWKNILRWAANTAGTPK
jgi:uncharacterized membrane protein